MTPQQLSDTDIAHLRRSLELAVHAGESGNRPFGAVLVDASGRQLAEGMNQVASSGNFVGHAEIDALLKVPVEHLADSTVYASGEPCPMCSAALVWAGVGRVVFAAAGPEFGPLLPGPHFTMGCREVIASSDQNVEILGPALGDEALAPFRIERATWSWSRRGREGRDDTAR